MLRLTALGIAGVCIVVGAFFLLPRPKSAATQATEVIQVPAGSYQYRLAGAFRIGNRTVDAPLEDRKTDAAFEIMKYQVSEADFRRCEAAEGCMENPVARNLEHPKTFANFQDALDYAAWFSKETGQNWRLPTDEEWVRAAAEKFSDLALGTKLTGGDPSQRWIANYQRQSELRGDRDPTVRETGGFGENTLGIADLAGNVWEWTSTCFVNGKLSKDGKTVLESSDYCGVRVAQGKHRAFIIDFVRDARGGGCAVGIPPDSLGFRLVRQTKQS